MYPLTSTMPFVFPGIHIDRRNIAFCEPPSGRPRSVHFRFWRASCRYGISDKFSVHYRKGWFPLSLSRSFLLRVHPRRQCPPTEKADWIETENKSCRRQAHSESRDALLFSMGRLRWNFYFWQLDEGFVVLRCQINFQQVIFSLFLWALVDFIRSALCCRSNEPKSTVEWKADGWIGRGMINNEV